MGLIRKSGKIVDVWVPGLRRSSRKDDAKLYPSTPIDDLFETIDMLSDPEVGCVVIDTFSKAGSAILRYIANQDLSENKKTQRVRVKTATGKVITNPMQPDYGLFAATIDEWTAGITPYVAAGKFVVLVGHEKLDVVQDDDERYIDAFGGLEVPGRKILRGMPGALLAMLRMGKRKVGKGRIARVVKSEDPSPVWHAKDRLGVFPRSGINITVETEEDPSTYEEIENFRWEACRKSAEAWREWFNVAKKKGLSGLVGIYGPPGVGKTTFASGLVLAFNETYDKKTVYCDWDSEGAASLPERFFEDARQE